MSVTEKLANMRHERLVDIHTCLDAHDWIDGAWYDESQGITMDTWALMVANEMDRRAEKRCVA